MPDKKVICPKCNTHMERGYVPDSTHGTTLLGSWLKGLPKNRLFLTGIKTSYYDECFPIGAFRCPKCGFVELYANGSFKAE